MPGGRGQFTEQLGELVDVERFEVDGCHFGLQIEVELGPGRNPTGRAGSRDIELEGLPRLAPSFSWLRPLVAPLLIVQ